MMHRKDEIKPDFQAVKLDLTEDYVIDEEDKPFIEAIWDVFVYDKNTRTYCCEMTPSYFLIHAYTTVLFNDAEPTEEQRDRIDQKYCYLPTDSCYMHCSVIDNKPLKDKTAYDNKHNPFADEDEAVEYVHGNQPF